MGRHKVRLAGSRRKPSHAIASVRVSDTRTARDGMNLLAAFCRPRQFGASTHGIVARASPLGAVHGCILNLGSLRAAMSTMRHPHVLIGALLLAALPCATRPLAAQQNAYDTGDMRVEVLGLRHWTLATLQDSIARRVPGQTLHDDGGIVTLKDSLRFADVQVVRLTMIGGPDAKSPTERRQFLVIKVVEPQDSALVAWAPSPRGMNVVRPEYAAFVGASVSGVGMRSFDSNWLQPALNMYRRDSVGRAQGVAPHPRLKKDAERLWTFLDDSRSPASRDTALAALHGDALYLNRLIAVAVLVNFADDDRAWWGLVEALRDPHPPVRDLALTALKAMPPRAVDWTPALPALRLLLGGTNLRAFEPLAEALVQTRIDPAHAPALLRGNIRWALEHLGADNPASPHRTGEFLKHLNRGGDASMAPGGWEAWLRRL